MPPTSFEPQRASASAVLPAAKRSPGESAAPHGNPRLDTKDHDGQLTSEAPIPGGADLLLDDPRDGMGAVAWLVGALFFAGVFGVAYLMGTTWGMS